jgi:hypothetical protein
MLTTSNNFTGLELPHLAIWNRANKLVCVVSNVLSLHRAPRINTFVEKCNIDL